MSVCDHGPPSVVTPGTKLCGEVTRRLVSWGGGESGAGPSPGLGHLAANGDHLTPHPSISPSPHCCSETLITPSSLVRDQQDGVTV